MKQTKITDNSSRVTPLQSKEYKRISIKVGESREYACKSGKVVIVTKCRGRLSGVSESETYYQISDEGKIIQPLKNIGIINYLNRN